MGHANIYIRKENEPRWAAISDKSKWVNAYLEKSPPNSKVLAERLEEVTSIDATKGTAVFKPVVEELTKVPGVMRASEAPEECPGDHPIRMNCGREGCPY